MAKSCEPEIKSVSVLLKGLAFQLRAHIEKLSVGVLAWVIDDGEGKVNGSVLVCANLDVLECTSAEIDVGIALVICL